MPGFDESLEAAVSEAEGTPAPDAATGEATAETTEQDAAAGVTGEQDGSAQQSEAASEEETEDAGAGDSAGDEPVDEEEREWRNANVPKPFYERFRQVNQKAQQYTEALQQVLGDPTAYRNLFKALNGRDPFDAAEAPEAKQDPGQALLESLLPAEMLALTEDDFATDGEWRVYQAMVNGMKALGAKVHELSGAREAEKQASEQARIGALREQAKADFTSAVSEIEQELGEQLTGEQKQKLAQEASLYGDALPVKDAVLRTARIMFFDRAVQRGREQAAQIRGQKREIAAGRPPAAGASSGANATGLSFDAALERALAEQGIT